MGVHKYMYVLLGTYYLSLRSKDDKNISKNVKGCRDSHAKKHSNKV